ncbi:glycoside hydrolase family 17 protein [Cadophora sp. DSE1049]|nr:glycoside hydrolase family 17 protein [Cadophora sp. DSE1049]
MVIPRVLPLFAVLNAVAAQERIYQGFNSGAFFSSNKPKVQSDFEDEFNAARALHFSPGTFSSVRLYTNVQTGTTNTPIEAFQAAINTNTSMLLGIWCSGTTTISNELAALKSAIDKFGTKFTDLVVAISVGSEDMYRLSESGIENQAGIGAGPDTIVNFIKEVRTAIEGTGLASKPVGHVDSWSAWANSSNEAVIEEVDFLGMDLYPYYEKDQDNRIENAEAIFEDLHNRTLSAAGNKPVWITETGWPFSGPTSGNATSTPENAKAYWDTIACKYLGRNNVWWYNLRDTNPAIEEKFALSKDVSAETTFNLTCAAGSGAPATINTDLSKGVSSDKKDGAAQLMGSMGVVGLVAVLSAVLML